MSGTITAGDDNSNGTGITGQEISADTSCVSNAVCRVMQVRDIEMGEEGEDMVFYDCMVRAFSARGSDA